MSADSTRTVRVYNVDDKYKAEIVRSYKPEELGKLILWDLVYDEQAEEWNDGKIKLPDMSHEVDCFIKMINTDSIKITGYHGWRILGSSEVYLKEF